MIQVNFKMEKEEHMDLAIAAKEEDMSLSQVLRKLVRQHLLARAIAKKKGRDNK